MPPTNSITSPSEHSETPQDAQPDAMPEIAIQELNALQQTLGDAMAQMDGMAAALHEVMALFKAGALEGDQGDQWLAQVQKKVLPFVAETQSVLSDIADNIEDCIESESDL